MEAFAFVGYDAYKRWAKTSYGDRPEDYKRHKGSLTRMMLRAAGRIVPGLEERVVFAEIGTPLTNEHYVAATEGNLYGTSKTRSQVGPFGWQVKTEIGGLYLCGASTLGHGVLGATLSGMAVARSVLRCRSRDLLRSTGQSIRSSPPTTRRAGCPRSSRTMPRTTSLKRWPNLPADLAGPPGRPC